MGYALLDIRTARVREQVHDRRSYKCGQKCTVPFTHLFRTLSGAICWVLATPTGHAHSCWCLSPLRKRRRRPLRGAGQGRSHTWENQQRRKGWQATRVGGVWSSVAVTMGMSHTLTLTCDWLSIVLHHFFLQPGTHSHPHSYTHYSPLTPCSQAHPHTHTHPP